MNNQRLLTGLLAAALSGGALCAYGQEQCTLSLEELYEIAETGSTRLRQFFSAEEEALSDIEIARDSRLPEIQASASFSFIGDGFTTKRDFSDTQKAPIPHFGNNLGISVKQPVYTGGAITHGIELAGLKSAAARHSTEMCRDEIRFRLTDLYLDIYKCENLRRVVESNLESARKMLAEMQARHEQGVTLHNDITRYELLVSDLELNLIKLDNTLDILNRSLTVTAGLPDDTRIIPDTTILSRALPVHTEKWWQQEAAIHSPTLKLARNGVDISRTAEKLAKSERLPKIGLFASWCLDGPILTEIPPIDRNLSYWYVGVGVNYNISSLFKTDKKLRQKRIATRHAVESLDTESENVALAIRADHIRYMQAYEELKTRTKGVELAEKNYKVISTRYSAGMALITDMLDAADARLDAELRLVNARIDIIRYYYKLLLTSGKI